MTPSGSSSHDGSFELIDDGDGWRISDPFAHLTFKSSALWYFDLNGHQIPDDPTQTETAASPSSYALFPGLYTVRGTSPEVVATPPQQLLALPGSYSTVARPDVTMTAKGVEEYQRGVNTILDGCVADQQKASINDRGCTLRIAGRLRYGGHDYPGFDVWPIQWTVVSRPVVKPTVQATFLDTDITEPGVIQIKATARDGGQRIEVSRTCLLGSLPFYGGLPPNGTVTVRWKEKAGATAPARLHELYAQCDQPE